MQTKVPWNTKDAVEIIIMTETREIKLERPARMWKVPLPGGVGWKFVKDAALQKLLDGYTSAGCVVMVIVPEPPSKWKQDKLDKIREAAKKPEKSGFNPTHVYRGRVEDRQGCSVEITRRFGGYVDVRFVDGEAISNVDYSNVEPIKQESKPKPVGRFHINKLHYGPEVWKGAERIDFYDKNNKHIRYYLNDKKGKFFRSFDYGGRPSFSTWDYDEVTKAIRLHAKATGTDMDYVRIEFYDGSIEYFHVDEL